MRTRQLITAISLGACSLGVGQSLYFPPVVGTTWETTDPATLGWCPDRIDSLYAFLEARNTKAFIILKDGRIVLERYFGTFTQDSLWYWASAGKTLTSTLVGIAQEEGYLDIDSSTAAYLGSGWTSAPPDKEALITVRNQLTMTTGLDDGLADDDCTDADCLQYLADAGTRWAYHNAPYTILDQVVAGATGQSFASYFNSRIRNPIGMDGFWFPSGFNNVYASRTRSMARYGLLALNNMVWGTDTILHDADYFTAATTPSQSLNNSYGYLWWINGEDDFMVPGLQFVFPGSLMPDAPDDMYSALGKNDQLLNVVPSEGLVVVRLGNEAYTNDLVPITFNNEIWQHIQQLSCSIAIPSMHFATACRIGPVPCEDVLSVVAPGPGLPLSIDLFDPRGRLVMHATGTGTIDVSGLLPSLYAVRVSNALGNWSTTIVKQ